MTSLLNRQRPPVYCPGCGHDRVTRALDNAFQALSVKADEVVVVTDIGCSGLFDTFFRTHAFHGLHGRALTYALGLKMARPELTVVVVMGDGGLGIGGAHFLSLCRKNIDLTLLVLNNFNYGMTGGQYSVTTPADARVGSGFLNLLEQPMDPCQVARAAGAGCTVRASAYQGDLSDQIGAAIGFAGFSVMDIWGVCPGRYTRKNRLTPRDIDAKMAQMPLADGPVPENQRAEYSRAYRELANRQPAATPPTKVAMKFEPIRQGREEIVFLGAAGQRIVTAAEILSLAGISAGLHATQKTDYPITVLRGHSISEVVLSTEPIGFTGMDCPGLVLALADEGVGRRRGLFERLPMSSLILEAEGVSLPETNAQIQPVDFKALKVKRPDWALACLAVLAKLNRVISIEMLQAALAIRFKGDVLASSMDIIQRL
ncbi:MAG: 2-oxoglutarate synthase [Deltaproteobacteria bacterium]|nr:2-oxoglutarate synthase [Deltaproteobacteria bacterium]